MKDSGSTQNTERRLLIIETDERFRRNISEHLRLHSYKVYEACERAEAERIMRRKRVDVVLLGLRGFKQGALSLLKALKEMRPLTEIILMNSSENLSLSIEGMKLGAFDDLLIPFDMGTLHERIVEAYERKKERERSRRSGKVPSPAGG